MKAFVLRARDIARDRLGRLVTAIKRRERLLVLLAGLAGVIAVSAGLCGIALWIFPTAPPWAVRSIVAGGALSSACLGWRGLVDTLGHGALGLMREGRRR